MNLPDLLKRSDRAVRLTAGTAIPTIEDWNGELRSAVTLTAGTELTLLSANEFECLRKLPSDIGWRVWLKDPPAADQTTNLNLGRQVGAPFVVAAISTLSPDKISVLFTCRISTGVAEPVVMDWPSWATNGEGFHLRLNSADSASVILDTGPSFESRRKLLPLIKGKGIELGPGLNPHVLPSESVDISYVESASAEEWVRNYKKTDKPSIAEQKGLWSKYIVADAQMLSTIPDHSLDFIYSNHVFEHLMNPLGVLENWRKKLTPSGMVLGVVPDCRYIFDLRQPPSTVDDWFRQRTEGIWTIGMEQYERWCRFTAPYNTPQDLIARNYSIHVHFYTSETFGTLGKIVEEQGLFRPIRLETSSNHRDFGFLLRSC